VNPLRKTCLLAAAFVALLSAAGCTSRGITVTSKPPGAEVSINRRVVGVTPIRVGFTHYGGYRIELRQRGFETLVKEEDIKPGFYGYDPVALVADNIIPARLNDEVYLHYVLKPIEEKDARAALLDRAMAARNGDVTDPKTGKEIHVALTRPPKRTDEPAEPEPAATAVTPPVTAEATAPSTDPAKPQGLRLADEYGLTPEEKKPEFVKPEEPRVKKPEPAAPARTPQPEELIFDEPVNPAQPETKKAEPEPKKPEPKKPEPAKKK
jgi:hypothetical protein